MQCPRCGCTALLQTEKFNFCPQCGFVLSRDPSIPKVVDGRKPNEDQSVAGTKTHSGEGTVFAFLA